MKIQAPRRRRAFTLFEGLVIGTVLLLLLALFLPVLGNGNRHRSHINCVNNLKQVGLALRIWEGDNNDKYPMEVPLAAGGAQELVATGNVAAVFEVMSNELAAPKLLLCPEDARHHAATNFDLTPANLSYFIGLDGSETNPATVLSGDANLVRNGRPVAPGILSLWTNTPTWSPDRHRGYGYILVADGSVQVCKNVGFASLPGTYYATNRIVTP